MKLATTVKLQKKTSTEVNDQDNPAWNEDMLGAPTIKHGRGPQVAPAEMLTSARLAGQLHSKNGGSPVGPAFALIAFGTYLLAGSCYGLTYAKWPFFMPPQLDIFGFLLGLFGEQSGGYIGGGLLGVLGLALAILGVAALAKRNDLQIR